MDVPIYTLVEIFAISRIIHTFRLHLIILIRGKYLLIKKGPLSLLPARKFECVNIKDLRIEAKKERLLTAYDLKRQWNSSETFPDFSELFTRVEIKALYLAFEHNDKKITFAEKDTFTESAKIEPEDFIYLLWNFDNLISGGSI